MILIALWGWFSSKPKEAAIDDAGHADNDK